MKLNIQRAISWWEKKNRKLPNLHIRGIFDMHECCYDVILQGSICLTVIGYFLLYLSVATCPSTFKEIGHSVQFVGLSSDDLTLSVCYVNGNQTLLNLYDVPTLGSSVCCNCLFCFVLQLWFVSFYTSQCIWLPLINFSSFQNTSNAKFGDTILTSDAGTHCLELSFKSANNKLSSYKYLPTFWL